MFPCFLALYSDLVIVLCNIIHYQVAKVNDEKKKYENDITLARTINLLSVRMSVVYSIVTI